GVDPANGKPLWYKNITDGDGDVTGRTTTSDYNEATRYYLDASPQPTDYGSINTHLNVKGVFVDAMLTYTFGNKVWDVWADYMKSDGRNSLDRNQLLAVYKDRWQEPGDNAKNPQIIAGGNMQSGEPSSRWIYRGDYLRLQNVRI